MLQPAFSGSWTLRAFRLVSIAAVATAACSGPKGTDLFAPGDGAGTPTTAGGSAANGAGSAHGGVSPNESGGPSVGARPSDGAMAGSSVGGQGTDGRGGAPNGAGGSNGEGGHAGKGTEAGTNAGGAADGEAGAPSSDGCSLNEIVTEAVFEQMFPTKARDAFYTYEGFLDATSSYPEFGTKGDCDTRKRDVAAFFANVAHQTSQLHYVEQLNKTTACASTVPYAPCAPGKKYYGRGPMQLSWNYNYYAASTCLGLGTALLSDPDVVAGNAVISWRTGLWFWNTGGANKCQDKPSACNVPPDTTSCDSPHKAMTSGKGFGATIQLVNGATECVDKPDDAVKAAISDRVCYYQKFAQILGTTPGPGPLSCGSSAVVCP